MEKQRGPKGTSGRPDTELTEAIIRFNTERTQKIHTGEKQYTFIMYFKQFKINFPPASGRKDANARKMSDDRS